MQRYQLGVLGAGNMGLAIARGAVQSGKFAKPEVLLFNRDAAKRAARAEEGFAVTADYPAVWQSCDWVLLGVKPQNMKEILPRLAETKREGPKPLVISVAAGVTFATLEQALGADCPIVRAMPNTPLALGYGATGLVKNAAARPEQLGAVRALFESMGAAAVFEREEMLNEVIPYNGSLPAYVYLFIDAMAQSAAQHGLQEDEALRLICETVIGSAKMVLAGEQTPAALTKAVCSPGGATLEAIQVLEARGLRDMLCEASDRCIARAYELGKM